MRVRQDTQPQIIYQLPDASPFTTDYFERYDRISAVLDRTPEIVDAVHDDLKKPLSRLNRRGPQGRAPLYTSDTVLRILLVKILEDLSFRGTVIRIDDSTRLRFFTRIHNAHMMSASALCRLVNAIQPETWKKINRLLAQAAVAEGTIDGERLRIDTTAVETNIHYPTDSALLWDVYRTLARLVRRLREFFPMLVSEKRLHDKRAKRLHRQIGRASNRRSQKAKDALKRLYGRLIALIEGILDWVSDLGARLAKADVAAVGALDLLAAKEVVREMEDYRVLGLRAVDQARRRVLRGESVPNDEKIFSIFEPHTELLKRGKAGKDVEFGHMVSIQQVQGSFISDYGVFEKRPADHALVDDAIESHEALFGAPPAVLAADQGFWKSVEKRDELAQKIPLVSIRKKGNRTEEEKAREGSGAFQRAQWFRAGVEGSISFLKRILGLWRCMNKGFDHFVSTVGATVFAHNLLVMARGAG